MPMNCSPSGASAVAAMNANRRAERTNYRTWSTARHQRAGGVNEGDLRGGLVVVTYDLRGGPHPR